MSVEAAVSLLFGLVLFLTGIVGWLVWLELRYRKPPPSMRGDG